MTIEIPLWWVLVYELMHLVATVWFTIREDDWRWETWTAMWFVTVLWPAILPIAAIQALRDERRRRAELVRRKVLESVGAEW